MAKASAVLETVARAEIVVFMDTQLLQAENSWPSIQAKIATAERIAKILRNTAPISHIQEINTLRPAGSSNICIELSVNCFWVWDFMVRVMSKREGLTK